MRYFLYYFLLLFLIGCSNSANVPQAHLMESFRSVAKAEAVLLQKGTQRDACAVCGMNLPRYYKTNHAAITKAKEQKQYCSLHCLVHDNEINKTDLYDVKAVDLSTLKFIPAQSAYYVVGSSKPATMSRVSKYAFAKRSDADSFVKEYGGHVMNFYDAYTVAYEDFVQK